MKKIFLAAALLLALTGCSNELVNGYSMQVITPAGSSYIAWFKTKEACFEAVNKRVQVTFTDVVTYTASDEEEHGLGLVLVCVEYQMMRRKE
jgi:ABC-type Co2+ transport system permease subunit